MARMVKINTPSENVSLLFLFYSFLKIGATSFGGFMALISVVQKKLSGKNRLITDDVILDGISLASVLPGPVAFNVIIYIGYTLRGIKGALVSMLGILLPSFIFMIVLSMVYVEYGQLPVLTNFFKGVLPSVVAIIVAVAFNMAKKQIKDVKQIWICLASIVALFLIKSILSTFIIITAGGLVGYFLYRKSVKREDVVTNKQTPNRKQLIVFLGLVLALGLILVFMPLIVSGSLRQDIIVQRELMLTFSGISVTLFGGGYVIIPAMQEIIVTGLQWLTEREFADSIAMGQLTPGPIFISATFIGFKVGGLLGAITSTLSIFVPPMMVMILVSEFFDKIKESKPIKAAFKGLRPAVIGMILSAAFTMGKSMSISWFTVVIFLAVLVASARFKIDVIYLIPISGILGILFFNFL
ncbi:MAG: chromate efflux transporter [Muricauda sp. TMED12]|nr:MAG: chromate efflux transporter [Muricauda sp. TMED12]